MPQTLYLECFSDDFSNSTTIDFEKLNELVANDNQFKLTDTADEKTLLIYNYKKKEWFPLLWLKSDYASINQAPIFSLNLYYDLVEIANKVNATIISDDGYVFFTPEYGLLYDPEENLNFEIEISELIDEQVKTNNVKLAIENINQKRRSKAKQTNPNNSKIVEKLESKQHYVAVIFFAIMIIILLIKKLT